MPTATTTRHKNSFGNLLRQYRKRAGLNQQQFADYLAESPKRISNWETGVIDPPGDPAFYQRLQTVPGFSEADIALLMEAREVDESAKVLRKHRAVVEDDEVVLEDSVITALVDFAQKLLEEKAKVQQKISEALEKSLKIRAAGVKRGNPDNAGIKARREGIFGKPTHRDLARAEADKANRDREILTAQHLAALGKYAASGEKYIWDVIASMRAIDDDLHDEQKPIEQTLTKFGMKMLTEVYAETLTWLSAAGLAEIAWVPTQATPATLPAVIEAEEPSAEGLPGTDDGGIISLPMPHEVVENGDHLAKHISELQSQATLGSEKARPTHYPHENVVFHVSQLQAEALGRQRTKKDSGKSYEVVATLRDAAERTGVADDDILTTSEIEADYHINKKLVHEYTKRGRKGQPHLTPLGVRLARGGGSSQLLFRREDIERIVTDPPKTGRPPK
jgi:transcriptional regulator with XRE-family HTH domain